MKNIKESKEWFRMTSWRGSMFFKILMTRKESHRSGSSWQLLSPCETYLFLFIACMNHNSYCYIKSVSCVELNPLFLQLPNWTLSLNLFCLLCSDSVAVAVLEECFTLCTYPESSSLSYWYCPYNWLACIFLLSLNKQRTFWIGLVKTFGNCSGFNTHHMLCSKSCY